MKVMSLFSGIGGFELGILKAFWKENVSLIGLAEIDKFSSAVLATRFPWITNYGDVSQIDTNQLPDFDVLVGGSPCQDLSIANKHREGLLGNRSGLFLEYVRILREKKPAFFVLENVASMNKDSRDFISETLGVEPILINSALLTAQNRPRYYWTNIPWIMQPEDANIWLNNILETKVDESYFVDWQARKGKQIHLTGNEKTPVALEEVRNEIGKEQREKTIQFFGKDSSKRNKNTVHFIARTTNKANCLTGGHRALNLFVVHKENGFWPNSIGVRRPTPIECERLQGFPENRTLVAYNEKTMSNYQRCKQTSNAVTVNVIQHIFSCLKKHLETTWKGYQSSNLPLWFVTPKSSSTKKEDLKKSFIAYYTIPQKKGLSLDSQKAIVSHFVKIEKGTIEKEFIAEAIDKSILLNAIAYCKDTQVPLMIASLDSLGNDAHLLMSVKRKLGKLFVSCDLPASDGLTLSIALGLNQRGKELISIRTKAGMRAKKMEGQTFGNIQNLTNEGRKLGLAKIKANAENNVHLQKVLEIIEKCRADGMGWGKIARSLNEFGYRTANWKQFHKTSLKRFF